jgi:REP element-mobilizing transposase RayT
MAQRKPQMKLDFRRRRKDGCVAKKPGPKPKPKGKRHVAHVARPEVSSRHPVHVTMRVVDEVAQLRTRKAYQAVRRALQRCAARSDYRVVQISIQKNHIHAICEADSKDALTRGMQSFEISAAKQLNRAMRRKRGQVFASRYHTTSIETPTQARSELAYVLNNWLKHRASGWTRWQIDPWSSASQFTGWATPHGQEAPREPLPVVAPQSWLLREGWMRARAGPIGLDEVPGPARG